MIGVTRTTLREVLQRLARDGWLTIQHGKPTKVNQFMETSGLHILDTLMTLDAENATSIVEDLLAARTNISPIFMRYAFKLNKESAERIMINVIESCEALVNALLGMRLSQLLPMRKNPAACERRQRKR